MIEKEKNKMRNNSFLFKNIVEFCVLSSKVMLVVVNSVYHCLFSDSYFQKLLLF